ncbi:MAG: hypothetical protein ACI9FJ_002003 [Alteromonadaceae bacterium]|jgi:hypothetical protein
MSFYQEMSYKEKSVWVSFAVMLAIWVSYFNDVISLHGSQALTVDAIHSLLLKVVILTIVAEIVMQIIVAIIDHKQANDKDDERDKLITLYGKRNAYSILVIGVFAAVFQIIVPTLFERGSLTLNLPNEYFILHVIILSTVMAETVNASTRLFYYRRGL